MAEKNSRDNMGQGDRDGAWSPAVIETIISLDFINRNMK
jgi:hypothetical protein